MGNQRNAFLVTELEQISIVRCVSGQCGANITTINTICCFISKTCAQRPHVTPHLVKLLVFCTDKT